MNITLCTWFQQQKHPNVALEFSGWLISHEKIQPFGVTKHHQEPFKRYFCTRPLGEAQVLAALRNRSLRRKCPCRKTSRGDVGWNLLCSKPFPAVPAGRRPQSAATWLGDILGGGGGEEGRTHNTQHPIWREETWPVCQLFPSQDRGGRTPHAFFPLPLVWKASSTEGTAAIKRHHPSREIRDTAILLWTALFWGKPLSSHSSEQRN